MNYSRAIFAINDDVRCVRTIYDPDHERETKLHKTFDPTIKVDDLVIVETGTRYNMTVVKVTEVDIEPDLKTHKDMGWVVGRVDTEAHEQLKKTEAEAIDTIKKLERKKARRELREEWMGSNGDELKALPIYSGDAPKMNTEPK